MNYTTSQMHLSKLQNILTLIQKAEYREIDTKLSLSIFDLASPLDDIRLYNTREGLVSQIEINKKIKQRLISYYGTSILKYLAHIINQRIFA
jgi:hypothetical protein